MCCFDESADLDRSCPESRELVRGLRGVMEYARRIHDFYFPDYVKWDWSESVLA